MTLALYDKARVDTLFNENHGYDYDIIIPLPTADRRGYYAYRIPDNREIIIAEIIDRIIALCNSKEVEKCKIDPEEIIENVTTT